MLATHNFVLHSRKGVCIVLVLCSEHGIRTRQMFMAFAHATGSPFVAFTGSPADPLSLHVS